MRIFSIFLFSLMLASGTSTHAQRRGALPLNLHHYEYMPYNFGFVLGFNRMNFSLQTIETDSLLILNQQLQNPNGNLMGVLTKPDFGFHIGIVSNLRLTNLLDLRFVPTLSFGERTLEYRFSSGATINQPLEATYIEFPLHLKYKSRRIQNTRAFLIAGMKFSTDLSSNQFKDEADGELIYIRTHRNDWHYELGAGIDQYFHFFKFSVEIKASFGLRQLQLPGEHGLIFKDPISRLNSKNVMVSFIFE